MQGSKPINDLVDIDFKFPLRDLLHVRMPSSPELIIPRMKLNISHMSLNNVPISFIIRRDFISPPPFIYYPNIKYESRLKIPKIQKKINSYDVYLVHDIVINLLEKK
jgi:hypothetical protein